MSSTRRLGEIVRVASGSTPKTTKPEYWDGEVAWVTPADLSRGGQKTVTETTRRLTEEGVSSCATSVLPAGSVLLSSRAPIGLVAINGIPMATNQGFKSLIPSPEIDASYLYYWLRANRPMLESLGNGATFKELSKKTVEQLEVPVPPIQEQRRIAAILDHADALRAKRRQVLAHLDDLSQSLLAERYMDASLERMPLSDLALAVTKGTTPTSVGLQFSSDGVRFLRAQNLQGGKVAFGDDDLHIDPAANDVLGRSQIYPADVLLSIAGTVGRVALVPEGSPVMNCNQAVAIIRLREPERGAWLSAWLQSPDARRQIRASSVTATISNLSLGEIKQLRVPCVSFTTALEFAKESQRLSRMRVDGEAAAGLDDELFASLQSRAFRGEL